MITFQYFEIMDRYARGGMTEQERSDFEAQLRNNKVLALEWSDYLLIARSVRNSLRSTSSGTTHIPQLVADARDLAKENGLLINDEDIWLYLRGQADPTLKAILEKRRCSDPLFDAQVDREAAIIEGIRKNTVKARLIQSVRDSLHEQGFTASVHDQIRRDMAEEQHQSVKPPTKRGNSLWLWLITILTMVGVLIGLWWMNTPDLHQELIAKETEQLKKDLPGIKSLQVLNLPGAAGAFRMVSNDLPDGALKLISNIPSNKKTPEITFLEGVAYFEKADYKNALSRLTVIDTSAGQEIHIKAQWLSALIYRSLHQYAASEEKLQHLLTQYSHYNPQPKEVVKAGELLSK